MAPAAPDDQVEKVLTDLEPSIVMPTLHVSGPGSWGDADFLQVTEPKQGPLSSAPGSVLKQDASYTGY